mmetsp:Transcript_9366/g.9351  ORF Transcript_9366/g.9351 Transcript_9366/m.9351 type:complete len:87 (+) Transcript_9366:119-379(+)
MKDLLREMKIFKKGFVLDEESLYQKRSICSKRPKNSSRILTKIKVKQITRRKTKMPRAKPKRKKPKARKFDSDKEDFLRISRKSLN